VTRARPESNPNDGNWRWADVFTAHHGAFFTYALHLEKSVHDAEDLVQSTLLRLARRVRPDRDAVAYAMAALRNLALDRRRRRMASPAQHESVGEHLLFLTCSDQPRLESDECSRLREAIEGLDDARREIVILKVYADLSLRQIAAMLAQPLGTVASSYRRALVEMKERLERESQNHERTHAI
jgi:RNA polymerase sigma-70 factor (ECF subfamily)